MTNDRPLSESSVWVVDDDRAIRWVLGRALERAGISARVFSDAAAVLDAFEASRPRVVVSDIRMPDMTGVELLSRLKTLAPDMPVIIMTAYSDLESAVSAYQGGAFEYLPKPFDVEKAVELISRALAETQEPEPAAPATLPAAPDLIGQAPAMQDVFRAIGRLSQSAVTVLLTGESGAGKEVVAHAIWKHSRRSRAPFIALNMAAIPRELLESELFGHEKGAFTGAVARRIGRFEEARGGTLFLDEIGDMPMELQTRLLRVLSSGSFYRVGGRESIQTDARIIAATNQDLEALVRRGAFREDLYHRLNVIRLRLPPLRERREDIAPLAAHFLAAEAAELGLEPKTLSAEALAAIERYRFPGNVRELENLCRWLLVMAPSRVVAAEDLPPEILAQAPADKASAAPGEPAAAEDAPSGGASDWERAVRAEVRAKLDAGERCVWDDLLSRFERAVILAAVRATGGRRVEAAERLGIGRNTLTRKIRELALEEAITGRTIPPHAGGAS